ncbi:MAG: hypothetical protein ACLQBQ_08125 [Smithella sp.]
MNKFKSALSSQIPFFAISLIIFIIAAIWGWFRLRYGFNLVDEGQSITAAWRLMAGDGYFYERLGALNLSPLLNSVIFGVKNDITLLGLREIQHLCTIFSLFILGIALYKIDKSFWYQPLIFSVFAFTGGDISGFIQNLTYNFYAHFFLTLHVSFFLLGIFQESVKLKRILLAVSGFFLGLISFNLLHLSLVVLSPVILFWLFNKRKTDYIFNFRDLCCLLAPIVFCWLVFIGIFNITYFQNVIAPFRLLMLSPMHSPKFNKINWSFIECIGIISIYIILILSCLQRLKIKYFIIVFSLLSLLMFLIINTSLLGVINAPLGNAYPNAVKPMWFSSLIWTFYIFFVCYLFGKIFLDYALAKSDILAAILLIPGIILCLSSATFSSIGLFSAIFSSIPSLAAASILILSHDKIKTRSYALKFIVLLIFIAPFYYSTVESLWRYPCLDVAPELATVEIDKGFCKGIRTNIIYKNLYEWISSTAERYSDKDDYIISYIYTPMVHMIAKRRPSLEDTYIDFYEFPAAYYENAIGKMIEKGREPKLVFMFEAPPVIFPLVQRSGDVLYCWFESIYPFGVYNDPISKYVIEHMYLLDTFRLNDHQIVRCFLRK